MKIMSLVAAAAVAFSLAGPAAAVDYPPQKVVYHNSGSSDPGYFKRMLTNVRNHLDAVGDDNIELIVVDHSGGVEMFEEATDDGDLAQRIDVLRERGVQFLICDNTLESRHIAIEDLYGVTEADIVPSGVAEIARLQAEGFVYLHP